MRKVFHTHAGQQHDLTITHYACAEKLKQGQVITQSAERERRKEDRDTRGEMQEAFVLLWLLTLHPSNLPAFWRNCLLPYRHGNITHTNTHTHTPTHTHKHGNWSQRWQQHSIVALSQGNIFDVRVLGNAASLSSVLQTNFAFFSIFFLSAPPPSLVLSLCVATLLTFLLI